MNKADFPGAIAHGAAWAAFCGEQHVSGSLANAGLIWAYFLKGWTAKVKQQDVLRGRRRNGITR